MGRLENISNALNRWSSWISGGLLVAMMMVTVSNLIMIQFGKAILGASEIVSFLAAPVAALALGYTQINRGHVAIDILVVRLPQRAQAVIDSIMTFISMALFGVATWQIAKLATRYWELGLISETLYMVFFPFIYLVAFGCALLCLVLLLDFLKSLFQAVKR
jgi:TRAP-type C4-dicarboxylate transport system permease small subunit